VTSSRPFARCGDIDPTFLCSACTCQTVPSRERIHRLREASSTTEIVVITMEQSQLFAEQASRGGAIGFVVTDTADAELCDAVRDAARSVGYESPRVRKL
jgi:DNA-binding NarL/FixJ family response regulator